MSSNNSLESAYYEFLKQKQYSSEESLNRVLSIYLPWFRGYSQILEIGCGSGEFLALANQAGHAAIGLDIDPGMVEICRKKGLEAYQENALSWLSGKSECLDAIFSSNVMEHMDPLLVLDLLRLAWNVLRPGGIILLSVPNPESVIVQFHEFWRDPTHVRLYHRQLLEFFLHHSGFQRIQSGENVEAGWEGLDVILPATNSLQKPDLTDQAIGQSVPKAPEEYLNWNLSNNLPHDPMLKEVPLPIVTPRGVSILNRLRYRMARFVFHTFLGPITNIILLQIKNHRNLLQQYYQTLEIHYSAITYLEKELEGLDNRLKSQDQRLDQLNRGYRFLYPSREIYVAGYKPEKKR